MVEFLKILEERGLIETIKSAEMLFESISGENADEDRIKACIKDSMATILAHDDELRDKMFESMMTIMVDEIYKKCDFNVKKEIKPMDKVKAMVSLLKLLQEEK